MELQSLSVQKRDETGKRSARLARHAGNVPAVVYGEKQGTVELMINARELGHVLHGSQGEHAIVNLEVEDNADLNGPALVKEVQHHPVRGHVMHADFLRIDLDKKITTSIPVVAVGRSKGVIEGGVLDFQCREVEIECLALNVPEQLEADVTDLDIGDNLHVSDLVRPDNIEVLTPADRAVVAIHAPRVARAEQEAEDEAAEAAAAAAEGGDAEGAEGGEGEGS